MKPRHARIAAVLTSCLLAAALPACRDSTSASTGASDDAAAADGKAAARSSAVKSGGSLPADYVPYRCQECSCRVFMGRQAECSRPTCEHHWSTHQNPLQ